MLLCRRDWPVIDGFDLFKISAYTIGGDEVTQVFNHCCSEGALGQLEVKLLVAYDVEDLV